jgi:hypothetical protein
VADIDADGKCRTSARINVMATVSGPPKKVGAFYTTAGPDHYSSATFMADPCWLGGGSDLPGTRVLVSGDFGGMPGTEGAVSHDITITLGPDTLAPTVTVTPASGDVREGETIHLKVTAREERDKGPWQTGVKRIQVSANHGDVVKEPWVNAADRASQQCAGKTWEQAYDVSYVVPPNPPSPIKLCALAEDYAGNPGYECAEFTVIQPDRFVWRGHIEDEYASVGRALSGGGVPRMPEPATFAYEVDVNFEYVQQKLADGSTAWPRRHIDWNLQGTTGDDTVTHRCAGNGSLDLAPASESAALTRDELDKLEAQCETTHASTSFRLYGSLPTSPPLPKIPSISALDENCRYREETGRRRMSVSLTPCPRHTASR